LPTLDVDGTNVHYTDVGQGAPVVFLHSGGSTGAQWRKTCNHLEGRWRLLSLNFYGLGGTDPWPGPDDLTHDDEGVLVAALAAALGEPIHLVGHSYGGAVALRLAVTNGAPIRSLTLVEPMAMPLLGEAGETAILAEYNGLRDRYLEAAEAGRAEEAFEPYVDYWNGEGSWSAMPGDARAKLGSRTAQLCAAFRANSSNPTTLADCRALSRPTLILCGGATRPPAERVTEILAREIPGARRTVIPGAGHMSPLTHAAEVAAAIAAHLEHTSAGVAVDDA
jgi:pimeloyl-ACP methyl ester carboxylesterase